MKKCDVMFIVKLTNAKSDMKSHSYLFLLPGPQSVLSAASIGSLSVGMGSRWTVELKPTPNVTVSLLFIFCHFFFFFLAFYSKTRGIVGKVYELSVQFLELIKLFLLEE